MKTNLVIECHTEAETEKFANDVDIPLERAVYVERMRQRYLSYEYNYIREDVSSKKPILEGKLSTK